MNKAGTITRLPGERPLFDMRVYNLEREAVDAEAQGRDLTQRMMQSQSIDLATRSIHASPLFADLCAPQPPLFSDPTFNR